MMALTRDGQLCPNLAKEVLLSAVVTLHSLEIYTTHELLASTPTVYFRCSGENKTYLPDVEKKKTLYTFRGEESFQPLMKFKVQNVRDVDSMKRIVLRLPF
ncbi:hypothetical protein HanRHA438_Chr13g0577641 [Helianthus annuus]|nr:hypothetical protein HanIR_Chr13g0616511 [Helianthus annuus]KAJ0856361.1 hypothetical protein HanRHA438_Chr13g0577641 [Helianthus annuus]